MEQLGLLVKLLSIPIITSILWGLAKKMPFWYKKIRCRFNAVKRLKSLYDNQDISDKQHKILQEIAHNISWKRRMLSKGCYPREEYDEVYCFLQTLQDRNILVLKITERKDKYPLVVCQPYISDKLREYIRSLDKTPTTE